MTLEQANAELPERRARPRAGHLLMRYIVEVGTMAELFSAAEITAVSDYAAGRRVRALARTAFESTRASIVELYRVDETCGQRAGVPILKLDRESVKK